MTNLFGGLLGSTFNYVFQTQLEKLQDGDRLYYLARTPGMNLRTQLEGNSFSEMIQRNTDGHEHAEGRRVRNRRLQVPARQHHDAVLGARQRAGLSRQGRRCR